MRVPAASGNGGAASSQAVLPRHDLLVTDFFPMTSDGWTLHLRRYRSRTALSADRLPVVLCHGLSCNGRFWDLAEKVSLVRYLVRLGYDVWVPTLRGAGLSTKPALSIIREALQFRLPDFSRVVTSASFFRKSRRDWNLEDYVHRDIPAIIDTVKRETGRAGVVWIGHSMGGMAMFGYLIKCNRGDVACLVTLGSPMYMPQPPSEVYRKALAHVRLLRIGRALFNSQFPAGIGVLTGRLPLEYLRGNRDNLDTDVMRSFYRNVMDDVPAGLLNQLLDFVATGSLVSSDGSVNYSAELGQVKVPVLCIAGAADNMCDSSGIRMSYENVGSTDRTYAEMGLSGGFSADYGHIDLVLGRNASREVYPLISNWLAQRSVVVTRA